MKSRPPASTQTGERTEAISGSLLFNSTFQVPNLDKFEAHPLPKFQRNQSGWISGRATKPTINQSSRNKRGLFKFGLRKTARRHQPNAIRHCQALKPSKSKIHNGKCDGPFDETAPQKVVTLIRFTATRAKQLSTCKNRNSIQK